MTASEVLAALADVIDHPDPVSPGSVIKGTAAKADQPAAANLIPQIQRALTALTTARASTVDLNARAAWVAKRDAAFAGWSRSVQALETLVQRAVLAGMNTRGYSVKFTGEKRT